jgi:hypothetical protein
MVNSFTKSYVSLYRFTYGVTIHESPFTVSVRKTVEFSAIGDISHNPTGILDGGSSSKQNEDGVGCHRYEQSEHCTLWDGFRGVL